MEQRVQHIKEPGIFELLGRLPEQASLLVRSEVALAKAEMGAKIKEAVKNSVIVAVGGVILYLGLLAAIATVIIVLAIFTPLWASALIITLVLLIGGGIVVLVGVNGFKKLQLKPTRTLETLKENMRWLRQQTA